MIIIGITGTIGAGKGTIVDYLEKQGFAHYSARSFIVQEVQKRGLPVNRDGMVAVADDLRATHSPSYIIEELYRKAEHAGKDAVIESVRAEGEVMAMRGKPEFYLVAIDADPEIRYKRIRSRGNETDAVSFEKFISDEIREINPTDPTKGNLRRCIELADYKIMNDGSVEELDARMDDILKDIRMKTSLATP